MSNNNDRYVSLFLTTDHEPEESVACQRCQDYKSICSSECGTVCIVECPACMCQGKPRISLGQTVQ